MIDTPTLVALQRTKKAKFGFKAYLHAASLFPITGWLRDNLPPAGPDTWWFTLNGVSQLNIYTDEPEIAAKLQPLTKR